MLETENGWMWSRTEVEKQGFKYSGVTLPDGSQWRMREACKDLNVTLDSVHVFRIAEGKWEVFYNKNMQTGYKEVGILEGVL